MYNAALKLKWGNAAVLDYAMQTAREEGINEGIEKGIKEERAKAEAEKLEEKRKTVLFLHGMGMQLVDIATAVGLSYEVVVRMLADA